MLQPKFRGDLQSSRVEEEGVVYYTIEDPETHSTFRLYEIEYLIAKGLDGNKTVDEVIASAKQEYNFDLSPGDLHKFVGQLSSMGFMDTVGQPIATTMHLATPTELIADGSRTTGELPTLLGSETTPTEPTHGDQPSFALEEGPSTDTGEINRLLTSAFLHIRQGVLIHARDYLRAAVAIAPGDVRLSQLSSSADLLGAHPSSQELSQLWAQCKTSFPKIAQQVGPILEDKTGNTVQRLANRVADVSVAWQRDQRFRMLLAGIIGVLLLSGLGGFAYLWWSTDLFRGPLQVETQLLAAYKAPLYAPGFAQSLQGPKPLPLTSSSPGHVEKIHVEVGSKIEPGMLLVQLTAPPPIARKWQMAQSKLQATIQLKDKTEILWSKLQQDRQALEQTKREIELNLRSVRANLLSNPTPTIRKEADGLKQRLAQLNKQLGQHAKKESGPKKMLELQRKRAEQMQKAIQGIEGKMKPYLIKAQASATVTAIAVHADEQVKSGQILLQTLEQAPLRLRFALPTSGMHLPQVGGQIEVAIKELGVETAKVYAIKTEQNALQVDVDLNDENGILAGKPLAHYRLITDWEEHAFRVRPRAVMQDDNQQASVWLLLDGHLQRCSVAVLGVESGETLLQDKCGKMQVGGHLVVATVPEQPLHKIHEDAAARLQENKR